MCAPSSDEQFEKRVRAERGEERRGRGGGGRRGSNTSPPQLRREEGQAQVQHLQVAIMAEGPANQGRRVRYKQYTPGIRKEGHARRFV